MTNGKRSIKFRAWDGNKMVYERDITHIGLLDNDILRMARFWCNIRTDSKVMQFTGLLDKNGVEIYEGDILSYKSAHPKHEGKVFNNVVEFAIGQSLCGWRMRNKRTVVKATPYKFSSSEIIGNIYNNTSPVKP